MKRHASVDFQAPRDNDASALLGSFLITAVQLAAMSRADLAESKRVDVSMYVDEFGCFATEAFAGILREARKYRLNLIVANQYLEKLSDATLAAVFGNVGSLLIFQVGAQDAPTLADQLGARRILHGHLARLRFAPDAGPATAFRQFSGDANEGGRGEVFVRVRPDGGPPAIG